MISASLNWASSVGILLLVFSIPNAISAFFSTYFVLQRRVDTSPNVLIQAILSIWLAFFRLFIYPYIAFILIARGWMLDLTLQFAFVLLIVSLMILSFINLWTDYKDWRLRQGRSTAIISTLIKILNLHKSENPKDINH